MPGAHAQACCARPTARVQVETGLGETAVCSGALVGQVLRVGQPPARQPAGPHADGQEAGPGASAAEDDAISGGQGQPGPQRPYARVFFYEQPAAVPPCLMHVTVGQLACVPQQLGAPAAASGTGGEAPRGGAGGAGAGGGADGAGGGGTASSTEVRPATPQTCCLARHS
jgi:hypothetical protein